MHAAGLTSWIYIARRGSNGAHGFNQIRTERVCRDQHHCEVTRIQAVREGDPDLSGHQTTSIKEYCKSIWIMVNTQRDSGRLTISINCGGFIGH